MNVKDTLKKHQFQFKKKFGQNFITDDNLLRNIAEAAELSKDDVVIEVGPGAATLTHTLAEYAKTVIAIEIDTDLEPIIMETMADCDNFHLVMGDALQMDLDALVKEKTGESCSFKVVANLPYYITTPLVMHFLEQSFAIDRIVIMVQKEVAERFAAAPGTKDYGSITAALNYYGEIRYAFTVPRHMFLPQPDVDSAVVDIRPWEQKQWVAEDEKQLDRIIRAAFGMRRKTLNNALKPLGLESDQLQSAMASCGISPSQRGETLSIADFVALSNAITELRQQ